MPQSLSGTLVHVSNASDGTGWCTPFMGLTANLSLVAQVFNGTIQSLLGPSISLNTWYHVVQTWSPTNGLRLYVNRQMRNLPLATTFTASNESITYVTLGNGLPSSEICPQGILNSTIPFTGAIDDFRVYSRELTSVDIDKNACNELRDLHLTDHDFTKVAFYSKELIRIDSHNQLDHQYKETILDLLSVVDKALQSLVSS
ncbi:unnamed protein product [Rotaria sp. Silwood2]|nr:unnamed protein product [Rotaria sp. Silwood2]CAF4313501.1 unnamed protein product [Rotaria sp. Silwood2]